MDKVSTDQNFLEQMVAHVEACRTDKKYLGLLDIYMPDNLKNRKKQIVSGSEVSNQKDAQLTNYLCMDTPVYLEYKLKKDIDLRLKRAISEGAVVAEWNQKENKFEQINDLLGLTIRLSKKGTAILGAAGPNKGNAYQVLEYIVNL